MPLIAPVGLLGKTIFSKSCIIWVEHFEPYMEQGWLCRSRALPTVLTLSLHMQLSSMAFIGKNIWMSLDILGILIRALRMLFTSAHPGLADEVPLVSLFFCLKLPLLGAAPFRWSFVAGSGPKCPVRRFLQQQLGGTTTSHEYSNQFH